jgi:hypothetical protein
MLIELFSKMERLSTMLTNKHYIGVVGKKKPIQKERQLDVRSRYMTLLTSLVSVITQDYFMMIGWYLDISEKCSDDGVSGDFVAL